MSIAERIWQVFVGAVLVITGGFILYAFHFLVRRGHDSWLDIVGMGLVAEAYSIVGSLFILLGLRYAFGPRSFIQRAIAHTTRHFVVAVILLSVAIAATTMYLLT